ncbi:hypothetical protein [Nocardia jiangxiensis]|uniref:hypothetical protein n=1 Tax=Nocardia jiangxiensis TaxID=282685 RepID=UPI000594DD0F|nr:hypothetical protein [Nocardia jiangxiensis]
MTDNVLYDGDGFDLERSRVFNLDNEDDSRAYQEFRQNNDARRVMYTQRETYRTHDCPADYAEDCQCDDVRETEAEAVVNPTPMYVVEFLRHWGLSENGGDPSDWDYDGTDSYHTADGEFEATYHARLEGFKDLQLSIMSHAVKAVRK